MPAIGKAFDFLGDDIIELSTENDASKNKIGSYDEKLLEESKAKLLKQIDDDKKAKLIMSRMKKTNGTTLNKWLTYLITTYEKLNLMTTFLKGINYKI